jgi:hypothetical protein
LKVVHGFIVGIIGMIFGEEEFYDFFEECYII